MLTRKTQFLILFIVAVGSIFLLGCENEKLGSLWDTTAIVSRPNPTITGIAPPGGALAAVDTLVITGTNFSVVPAENTVYFDGKPAPVLSATSGQLRLLSPLVSGENIKVKVGVTGAELFSNTVNYKLLRAIETVAGFLDTEGAGGMGTDASGNLYVAVTIGASDQGIDKITPAGERSKYAQRTTGVAQWSAVKFGPQGYLYLARNVRAIYRFAPGGTGTAQLWVAFPLGVSIVDFDYDSNNNLWAVGNNQSIYMVRQNATSVAFPFVANLRSARVYEGYLYVAGRKDNVEGVWRAPINGESLGTLELYVDLSSSPLTASRSALALTFSSDGFLYIGTEAPAGIIVVTPGKSISAPFTAYSSLLQPACISLAWGQGDALYAGLGAKGPIKITTRKNSAPYYGR